MSGFDFVVLGGGSAGFAGARTAAALGLRTAVIEGGEEVGGLCILRGCMPSKTLIESANRYRVLREAREFGLRAEGIGYDSQAVLDRKRRLVADFAGYRREQLETGTFAFLRGRAEFLDPWNVRVEARDGSAQTIRGRSFLIATGSEISRPQIPGIDLPGILDSDSVLETAAVPDSVIVLGAGPVALESAHYFEAFGAKVTIVQRSDHLLRGSDPDVSDALRGALAARGIRIFTGTQLRRIEKDGRLWTATFDHAGQTRTANAAALMNSLGRFPRTAGLGLEQAGVECNGKGVKAELTQQTSARHIFAAGDVCGPYEIVHIAIEQGELAARNAARLLAGDDQPLDRMDYRLKLFVAFTQPQVAVVGAHQAELQIARVPFAAASHPFSDHGKSIVRGETHGFVKLLAHRESGEILGGAAVGPEAGELIHEIVVAMRFRCTARDFARIPHYHPTLSEIWTYPAEELAEICGKGSICESNRNSQPPMPS